MSKRKLAGTYFYGNEASDYAKENGYLDYATLAKAFNAVLNNNIIQATSNIGYWDIENGSEIYYEDNDGNRYTYEEKEERVEELKEKLEELSEVEGSETEIEEIENDIEELNNEYYDEIFQYFIISSSGAEILEEYTDEIVFYNAELDMYVWGVTHCGTGWDYVLTDIKLNCGNEAFEY